MTSDVLIGAGVGNAAVAAVADALDRLADVDLIALGRGELLDVVRGYEVVKRRMAMVDHALVAQIDGRGVASEVGRPAPRRCCADCCGSAPPTPPGGSAQQLTWGRGGP